MKYLFHLSEAVDFQIALAPSSLETEGFVHLSGAHQVLRTVNRWFSHSDDVKLLVLRTELLGDALVWEDTHQHGEEFPHLYKAIPLEAIETIAVMRRDSSGHFDWPESLNSLLSPLLEAPTRETALIEPSRRFPERKLPEHCVLCFFDEVLEALVNRDDCQIFRGLGSEIGASKVYQITHQGVDVAVCYPGVGGPLAASTLEELIALGCQKFLLCGGAGSLRSEQSLGQLVVADGALRDEGLSHHYLSPASLVRVDERMLKQICAQLDHLEISYKLGTSWTTDALYRETASRIERRKESGCLTVEMELASLLAVSEFRHTQLAAILYCGDDLGAEHWDFRDWTAAVSVRERLFWLSVQVLVGVDGDEI